MRSSVEIPNYIIASSTALALGIFILHGLCVLLLGGARVVVQDAPLDESLWIRAVRDLVIQFVLKHVLLEL